MIYFDNSATTKPYPEVIESYAKVVTQYFGNPSSIHTLGSEAEKLLTQSRNLTATLLGVKSPEIIFTASGTEGNNLAIKGVALQHIKRGKHIITTNIEHPSVLEACKQLELFGFEVTYLPVDQTGRVDVVQLENAIREDTILVSVMHVNNELGSVQPIKEIGMLLKNYPKILFHVDNVQGVGKLSLPINEYGIDLCTFSGHKFHSVRGTGILFVREGVKLAPLLSGGGQEMGIRSGTENTAGIVAMTKALRMHLDQAAHGIKNVQAIKEKLMNGLSQMDGVVVNTLVANSAPHIVNFSVLKAKPEVIIQALSKKSIYVSTRSACSSKLAQASKVLLAAGFGEDRAKSAIRVSLSFENTLQEADEFLNVLTEIVSKLKVVMG